MWVNRLPYMRKCPKRFEAHRTGSFASYPVRVLFSLPFLFT
ncbi:hypothetical protein HMPREF1546_03138 [Oscillibacter sp. KLE 1745]|nr:hypothetical protein HMPREF1546_03138 [Oscillibacter sp. KLE 1745]